MDLKHQYFKVGDGPDCLHLVFTPRGFREFCSNINALWINNPERAEKVRQNGPFQVGITGTIMDDSTLPGYPASGSTKKEGQEP